MNTALILTICGLITAVGAAVVYIDKLFKTINQPYKDTKERLDKIDEYLDNDNRRINKLYEIMEQNTQAFNMSIKNDLVVLRHLESNNNTGEMQKTIEYLQNWLIDRKF